MKPISIRLLVFKAILLAPLALLFFVLGNIGCYCLALKGVRFPQEWPWQVAAREYYLYHGRAILQYEQDCMEFDELLFYRLRTGTAVFENIEFKTTITNVDGHRENPYLKGPLDAVIIGDSFAEGWGVNDQDTVASVLTRDHGLNTLTYGVSSYGTARALLALKKAIDGNATYKPSHLIIFYCTNDYEENVYYLAHGTKTYTKDQYAFLVEASGKNKARRSLLSGTLGDHTGALKEGYRKWVSMVRGQLDYGDLWGAGREVSYAEQARVFKEVLDANADLISSMRIDVISFKGWGGRDRFGEALASAPNLANGTTLNVILNTIERGSYYPLDGHLNSSGNKLMAKLIVEHLKP